MTGYFDTDHTIIPAADLLALTVQRFPTGGAHYAIERVLAIAVPVDAEEFTAAYWIVGNGWVYDQPNGHRHCDVLAVAAPANIRMVAVEHLDACGVNLHDADCSELRPWMTDEDLDKLDGGPT